MQHFLDVTVGDAAAQHPRRRGSFANFARMVAAPAPLGLGEAEADFLSGRDSFYIASVTADGLVDKVYNLWNRNPVDVPSGYLQSGGRKLRPQEPTLKSF